MLLVIKTNNMIILTNFFNRNNIFTVKNIFRAL